MANEQEAGHRDGSNDTKHHRANENGRRQDGKGVLKVDRLLKLLGARPLQLHLLSSIDVKFESREGRDPCHTANIATLTILLDLEEEHVRVAARKLLEKRGDLSAGPTPAREKVHDHKLPWRIDELLEF